MEWCGVLWWAESCDTREPELSYGTLSSQLGATLPSLRVESQSEASAEVTWSAWTNESLWRPGRGHWGWALAVLRPTLDTVSSGPWLRQLHHHHQWPQRRQREETEVITGSSSGSDQLLVTSLWDQNKHVPGGLKLSIFRLVYTLHRRRIRYSSDFCNCKLIFLINLPRCQWSLLTYLATS